MKKEATEIYIKHDLLLEVTVEGLVQNRHYSVVPAGTPKFLSPLLLLAKPWLSSSRWAFTCAFNLCTSFSSPLRLLPPSSGYRNGGRTALPKCETPVTVFTSSKRALLWVLDRHPNLSQGNMEGFPRSVLKQKIQL